MWVTKLGYRILGFFSDTDIPENTGDFKLLSRRVVDQLLRLDEYDPFLRGLVRWVRIKQTQIFYDRHARHAGLNSLWLDVNKPCQTDDIGHHVF